MRKHMSHLLYPPPCRLPCMPSLSLPDKDPEAAIAQLLISEGEDRLQNPPDYLELSQSEPGDSLLNDLKNYPHHFLLGCLMTPQIRAPRAFGIPWKIGEAIGGQDFTSFADTDEEDYCRIFRDLSLHRFHERYGISASRAIQRIADQYEGDASNIWADSPSSCSVVRRMLEFHGAGIKVATMTANILARDFRVPMSDKVCIDISPDVQVLRVFRRLGLITEHQGGDVLIYKARELHPPYPGIFDLSCWVIGRNWCRPTAPKCEECLMRDVCPSSGTENHYIRP